MLDPELVALIALGVRDTSGQGHVVRMQVGASQPVVLTPQQAVHLAEHLKEQADEAMNADRAARRG